MSDLDERSAGRRLLRNAALVALAVPAALLVGCAPQPAPPPPQPVVQQPAPPPPPPQQIVRGERG
jgi:hypothetical protein